MSMEKCLDLLLTRRSIRKFESKNVGDEIIEKILDVTKYAPSAKNSQPWEFIIVKDPEIKEKLGRIHRYAYPLLKAPVALIVLCNPELTPTSYLVDCANAAMYVMLAAHSLGLGTVWIQSLRNVRDILEIVKAPKGMIPVAILALGWPAERPEPKPRRELTEIVHLDTYGNRMLIP